MPSVTSRRRATAGFSLVEVLVAMVILALFIAGLGPMLSASVLLRRQQELIAEATNLAQLEMEEIRRQWGRVENRGLGAAQSRGGLVPVIMRERLVPLARPCEISEVGYEGCTLDPPQPPTYLALPASPAYPFNSDGFEVTSPDPKGEGPDDLYLYDPEKESPTTPRAASFTLKGLRGPQTYRAQVFWGYAPGSTTPRDTPDDPEWYRQEVVRVVVRIYLAGKDGELPTDSKGQPTRVTRAVRTLITGRSENLTDNSAQANDSDNPPLFSPLAPLVVLSADIARSYQ